MKCFPSRWLCMLYPRSYRPVPRARRLFRSLAVEQLEDRTVLAGHSLATATALSFFSTSPINTATASGFLSSSTDVDLYAVNLNADDQLTASVAAQSVGSGLHSYLRLFNSSGQPMFAVDEPSGTDAPLTVQVQNAGTYYLGVSVSGNDTYDPTTTPATGDTAQTGLYTLNLSRPATPPTAAANLVASQFQVTSGPAVWGQTISVSYQIDNRGAAASGAFTAQVMLASSSAFSGTGLYGALVSVPVVLGPFTLGPDSTSGVQTASVVLPPAPPGAPYTGFAATGPTYVGLSVNGAAVGPNQGSAWDVVNILPFGPAGSTNLSTNFPNLDGRMQGNLVSAGQVDTYTFTLSSSGELTATVHPAVANTPMQLTLLDGSGNFLAMSDGVGGTLDASLVQSLPAGTYSLQVQGLAGGTGAYTLTTQFVAGPLANQPIAGVNRVQAVAVGDFTGNGILDLAVANGGDNTVSVLLGNGDGTFQTPQTYAVGTIDVFGSTTPDDLVVGDFTGDGKLDLAVANGGGNTVSVLLGNGDGTFQAQTTYAVGTDPDALAVGNFNGDGKLDLAVANGGDNTVSVLLGNGDGTFQAQTTYAAGSAPDAIAVGDFTGTGISDLVVADQGTLDVMTNTFVGSMMSVLLGNGDGTFQAPQTYAVANGPYALTVGDFTGNGKLDIAVSSFGNSVQDGTVSVLLGNGNGTFQTPQTYAVGAYAYDITVGAFDGDGRLDLAVIDGYQVSVLRGNGDGTFQAQTTYAVGTNPVALAVGDFNGDGRLGLVVADAASFPVTPDAVSVLLGNGDGTFQAPQANPVGLDPQAVVVGDFGNGNLDLAVASVSDDTVTVLLGNGDGTFQAPQTYPVGDGPTQVAVGDFNGDGRLDLVVVNQGGGMGGSVTVLLGNGDGTFQAPQTYLVGSSIAHAVVVGDFNGDGRLDLATTTATGVAVLLGNGDGTFQAPQATAVGLFPNTLAAGDFNGDGHLDLAVAVGFDVAVLLGNGNGTFTPDPNADGLGDSFVLVGGSPESVAVGDFTGNGILDLAVANSNGTVSVLLGNGDGTFQAPQAYAVGAFPGVLAVGDFTGDGKLDLAVANEIGVSVLLGNGDGTFQKQQTYAMGSVAYGLAVGDFTDDGHLDIAFAGTNTVSVLLNTTTAAEASANTLSFTNASTVADSVPAVPVLANFSNPTVPDSLILRDDGTILYRQAIPADPGTFAPPIPVNPASAPVRDFALVATSQGTLVAALNRTGGTVTLYAYSASTGEFSPVSIFSLPATDQLPTLIMAANLTGNPDGLNHDLVVFSEDSGTVTVFLSNGNGGFQAPQTIFVGLGGSDLATAPGPLGLDILVTNQATGAVIELVNQGNGRFSQSAVNQFRAAPGPFGLDQPSPPLPEQVQSLQRTAGLTVGDFTGNGQTDIVAINAGGNNFKLLTGIGGGNYLDPAAQELPFSPGAIASGDFNHDGNLDLAILDPANDLVYIYLGRGDGTFYLFASYSAGNNPTGITVADVTRPGGGGPDGNLDLLIGNSFGDILVLPGNGDGTFQPYERVERGIPLAVVNQNGQDEFIFASQAADSIDQQSSITTSLTNIANSQSPQPVLGPGAVVLADLNGDGIKDLIVANSGSNDVLVFLGDSNGDGGFGNDPNSRFSFFAGDNPVGITVAYLKGPNAPADLVIANEGSNDVSILYGSGSGSSWTMTYGPRLKTGGIGPVSTVVANLNGANQPPDILASNSVSNDVGVIPGTGQGLFNDTNPTLLTTGARPGQIVAVTTATGPGFVVLNTASSTLTELSGFNGTNFTTERTINAGGLDPVAVVAVDLNIPGLTFGLTDLIVADANTDAAFNQATGDDTGNLALLVGDDTGFDDAETFTDPGMPNPSAVALSAVNGDSVFYATTEGVEHAFRFEIAPPVAQQTPIEGSPGAFAPVLTTALASETGVNPDLLFQAATEPPFAGDAVAGEGLVGLGQGPSTLGSFDLLAFAEGGKGDSSDLWQRLVNDWEIARNTWVVSVEQSASDGWTLAVNVFNDATDGTQALVRPMLHFTGLEGLEPPDIQWRQIGKQMWQVSYGSVETTWTGVALTEMRDRFQASVQDALAPWLPALPELPAVDHVPALEGGQEALRGLTEVLRSAAPPLNSEAPWQQTVDTVSRSLLEATGVVPVRPPTQPAPKAAEPVLLAGGHEEPAAEQLPRLLLERKHFTTAVLHDDAYREEREAFWLALAVVAVPLHRISTTAAEEPDRRGRTGHIDSRTDWL